MKTSLPPKANPMRLGHAKHGDAVKLELGDAVWVNPLIAPGSLAHFNGCATDAAFTISANRSISSLGLKRFFVALIAVCLTVACFSYMQGNILVPLFVALDLAIVCAATFAVAQAGMASDSLTVDAENQLLRVRSIKKRAALQQSFNISWVRLQIQGSTHAPRIYLTASGNSVEIGSFLNNEQRVSLASQLKVFLELAKARALN